jgi:hypothetical protein
MLKLEDELSIQEIKFVWKWEKKKLPSSLVSLLNEKVDNLRGRRFCIERQWKTNSLAYRIARAANINMSIITAVKTRKTLTTNLKKKILMTLITIFADKETASYVEIEPSEPIPGNTKIGNRNTGNIVIPKLAIVPEFELMTATTSRSFSTTTTSWSPNYSHSFIH